MATFTTDRTAAGVPAKYQAQGVFSDTGTYELSSTAAGSIIQMVKVAAGVTVLDMVLSHDDCGTATADVGITGTDADYFMDGVDIGSASVLINRMGEGCAVAPMPYTFATAGTIDLLTITNATTGTITLTVYMSADTTDLT